MSVAEVHPGPTLTVVSEDIKDMVQMFLDYGWLLTGGHVSQLRNQMLSSNVLPPWDETLVPENQVKTVKTCKLWNKCHVFSSEMSDGWLLASRQTHTLNCTTLPSVAFS